MVIAKPWYMHKAGRKARTEPHAGGITTREKEYSRRWVLKHEFEAGEEKRNTNKPRCNGSNSSMGLRLRS